MSGSSLDGIDLIFVELEEMGGNWNYNIIQSHCYNYEDAWIEKLLSSTRLNALEYQTLHADYGHYLGKKVNEFINTYHLEHQVHFVSCHGHTTFHLPEKQLTHQLGDGAAIAAETGLPVITDLRALDVALGGQGAPIVPIGEKLLFTGYKMFLNIGGIANISFNNESGFIAYDICPANKVLNLLAEDRGIQYDDEGQLASKGSINHELLTRLNGMEYYFRSYPKSLPNSFGTDIIYPLIKSFNLNTEDNLRTMVAHIVNQVKKEITKNYSPANDNILFISGGGALNTFLIHELSVALKEIGCSVYLPNIQVINFKEALIIALMGALRWREQNNVMCSVTGSSRNNIGGALWLGSEG